MDLPQKPHLFGLLAGLFLAVGIAFASVTLAGAWTHIAESQVVNVTGAARKNVRSDLVVWRAGYSVDDESLLGAHEKLKSDAEKVAAFLKDHGAANFSVYPLQIREITARSSDSDGDTVPRRVGYRLLQRIEVRSADVEATPKLATDTTELLAQGVALVSEGFEF